MRLSFVLVTFPFDDLSSAKVRPALCLTAPIGPYRHITVAFVTSRTSGPEPLGSDLLLLPSEPQFALTGLRAASRVCLHRMLTVPQSVMVRVLGRLPAYRERELYDKIKALFEVS